MYSTFADRFNIQVTPKVLFLILPIFFIINADYEITSAYILIAFAIYLMSSYRFNNLDIKLSNIFLWGLLLMWGLFVVVRSPEQGVGLRYYIATIFVPFLVFIMIINIDDFSPEFLRKLFFNFFIVGAILGAFSLYIFVESGFNTKLRLSSLWQDFNIMSTFLMVLSMFNLSIILNKKKNDNIFPYVITLIFIYTGIFLSQTRGVWLAIIVSFVIFVIKKPKIILPASILFLVVSVLFSSVILDRFLSVKNFGYDESTLGRLQAWYSSYILIRQNFFLGYGFDAYIHLRDSVFPFYIVKVLHSHSTYLRTILEMGFIGFVLYFSFIIRAAWYSFSFKTKTVFYQKFKVYIEGLQMSYVGLFITFIFEPYFSLYGGSALIIWILISICFKLKYIQERFSL